jgi:hypothetical protein
MYNASVYLVCILFILQEGPHERADEASPSFHERTSVARGLSSSRLSRDALYGESRVAGSSMVHACGGSDIAGEMNFACQIPVGRRSSTGQLFSAGRGSDPAGPLFPVNGGNGAASSPSASFSCLGMARRLRRLPCAWVW